MKIKKSIYSLLAGVSVMTGMSSCVNNWLDVTPTDRIEVTEGAIKNSADLKSLRVGMYSALKGSSSATDYYAHDMFFYGDLHGEDLQANIKGNSSRRGNFYYQMTYTIASQFSGGAGIWRSPYMVISRANRIIDAAEKGNLQDKDDEEAKAAISQYDAEAKVLRAMAHFDLARVYGKTYTEDNGASLGVPVVTTPLESEAQLKRNTVKEVYTQVLKDLTEAIQSGALPTGKTIGYINQWAAEALLTRVYLTMGENTNALATAEDIINKSPYKLWEYSEYATAWSKEAASHTNELLFEMPINDSNDWTDREGIAYAYAQNGLGYGDVVATKSFLTMLQSDKTDVRNELFTPSTNPQNTKDIATYGENPVFLNKMPAYNGDPRYANIPMLRLSEIYLSAAEAAFKLGKKDIAAKYLNAIIDNRYGDKEAQEVTAVNITLQRILIERRKELVGEGQRFFDAVRNNETITRYTNAEDQGWHDDLEKPVQSYNRDYFKALPPIPQDEIDANPAMKGQQNPGYGE